MKLTLKGLGRKLEITYQRDRQKSVVAPSDTTIKARFLNFGPGPDWVRPGPEWAAVDVDADFGEIVVDFQQFVSLPLATGSISGVYGSHVFEHISVFTFPAVLQETYRVLAPGGVFRLILPDARKSIERYLAGDASFELFQRRKKRAKERYGINYTLFECMRECFISKSGQQDLLGKNALAHQNAWDFETIQADLNRAGFTSVRQMAFQESQCDYFSFEGTYPAEANEDYRSLYVEAVK